jgi:hypothetical protein
MGCRRPRQAPLLWDDATWFFQDDNHPGGQQAPNIIPTRQPGSRAAYLAELDRGDASHPLGTSALDPARSHIYAPNFPLCRLLRTEWKGPDKETDGGECNKGTNKHPGLSPGMFLMFCHHGVCLAFMVMVRHEGASTPHELFFTRFENCPAVIVYDNGCNFTRYYYKREPRFYKDCRCLSDKFHSCNHTSCSWGFRMGRYPGSFELVPGVTVKQVNSEAAEQCNSVLENIRTSLAYMSHDNYITYLRHFLTLRNIGVKSR